MTDTPATPSKPQKNSSFVVPVVLAIVAVAVIGYVAATRTGIDKKMVAGALNVWGDQVAAYGKTKGEEIAFAYDDIEMKGEAAGRYATVKNPHLTFKSKAEDSEAVEVMQISTASIDLHPESVSMQKFKLVAAAPIEVKVNDESSGQIIASQPLELAIEQSEAAGQKWISSTMSLAPSITLASPNKADTLVIKTQPGASLSGKVSADMQTIDSADFQLNGLVIEDLEGAQFLHASSLNLQSRNQKQEDGNFLVSVKGALADLITTEDEMPYGALSATVDLGYRGPLPKEGEALDWSTTVSELNLADISLSVKDAAAKVTGRFTTGSGELLPVGSADLTITNFAFIHDELKKNGVFDKESDKVVNILLSKMTGKPLQEIKDLHLTIAREKGASLKFGNMTFEEAMAIVLTGGKLTPPPAAAPAQEAPAPAAPAPVVGQ